MPINNRKVKRGSEKSPHKLKSPGKKTKSSGFTSSDDDDEGGESKTEKTENQSKKSESGIIGGKL